MTDVLTAAAARIGDALFARMQRPGFAKSMDEVFRASPKELGEAAVRAAGKVQK